MKFPRYQRQRGRRSRCAGISWAGTCRDAWNQCDIIDPSGSLDLTVKLAADFAHHANARVAYIFTRGPRHLEESPRLGSLDIGGLDEAARMRIRKPTETKANALIGGQGLRAHPGGQAIVGVRANLGVVADSIKIDVVAAIEGEPKRIFSRMFLARIEAALHAVGCGGEGPGESATTHAGFESAIPENRAGGIEILRSVGKAQRVVPNAETIANLMLLDQEVRERDRVGKAQCGMNGDEPLPNGQCGSELVGGAELANDAEIAVAISGKHGVEDRVDIGSDAPAAREGFGAAFGVDIDGAADLREGLRNFVLAQEKISVAPGGGGRERIRALGLEKRVAGAWEVAFGFVGGGEVQPGVGRAGIEKEGVAIILDGAAGVRLIEGVLPIAAEEIPVLCVAGLQAGGGFVAGARAEAGLVDGAGVANAEVGEGRGEGGGEECESQARRDVGEAQKHSKVLCLHCIGDAR